jgi:hypothetical protein
VGSNPATPTSLQQVRAGFPSGRPALSAFHLGVWGAPGGRPADLELRHRRRVRCEDRVRSARDIDLRNLPLHDTAQNRIWPEVLCPALDGWLMDGWAKSRSGDFGRVRGP